MPIRVVVASDHRLSRSGLQQILKAIPDFQVVGEADSPGMVAELCRRSSPGVVVFEITVPGLAGQRAAAGLTKAAGGAGIVVVTANENVYYMRALLASGVLGYVLRKASAEELIAAIRKAFSGLRYIDPRLSNGIAELLLEPRRRQDRSHPGGLSQREAEVLRAVARGFTSAEIALQLRVGRKTVETYRARIQQKLGLRARADLVRYANAAGLLVDGEEEIS